MSGYLDISLETGPGSYEVQDSMGYLSHKYYNSPRTVIAKAKKTSKIFLSAELNKQYSGLESPGVSTYNPNRENFLSKSPSALFGKEERFMSHIKPLLNRSPGPVYSQVLQSSSHGVSFAKARRNSSIEPTSPAPWDYNPIVPPMKIPAVIFRSTYERSVDKFLTPGPGTYQINSLQTRRGAYVSKIGRSIALGKDGSPGPGSYETKKGHDKGKINFGSGKRSMDPRACNFYLDAKSYEMYRDT